MAGSPVADALVRSREAVGGRTDREGLLTLRGVGTQAVAIRVDAEGYAAHEENLTPPFDAQPVVRLEPAFQVQATIVGPDGLPPAEAAARFETGHSARSLAVSGGVLEADLPSATAGVIVVQSSDSESARLEVPAGSPGEHRDLGEVVLPAGLAVLGRVSARSEGTPVAGARVWTLRASNRGPLVAWMMDEVLQTTTREDGSFRLGGLAPGRVLLRVDAPGFARAHREVVVKPGTGNEAGVVELSPGATVQVVYVGRDVPKAVARLDFRGEGLEPDIRSVPLQEGQATFDHVPAGGFAVSVVAGERLLCESKAEVVGERDHQVRCVDRRVDVHGVVSLGEQRATGGTLMFVSADAGEVPEGVANYVSREGLHQQRCFTARRGDISAAVTEDGTFGTDELSPGQWRVAYLSPFGPEPTTAQQLSVPAAASFDVALTFPAGTVTGRVVDDEGQAIEGARVRAQETGAFSLSGAGGAFRLAGLAPGVHHLQASAEGEVSEPVEVILGQGGDAGPVTLEVSARHSATVPIEVLAADGQGMAGALVTLESAGLPTRMLTTDSFGRASVRFGRPYPTQVRAAAAAGGVWVLGDWIPWEQAARTGAVVRVCPTGSMTIETKASQGQVMIVGGGGWDLSSLLARMGMRPTITPDRALRLEGLPEGAYTVSLGRGSSIVTIRRDRDTAVTLP